MCSSFVGVNVLPNKNVSYRQPWDPVCLPPHSSHTQLSCNYLFCEVILQYTKEEQIIAWCFDAVSFDFSVNRDFDVRPEAQLGMRGRCVKFHLKTNEA